MTIENKTLPNLQYPGTINAAPLTGYEEVDISAGPVSNNITTAGLADTALVDQSVTATGTNQATGYAIVAQITNVTASPAGTGVVLSTANKPGKRNTVFNNGAHTLIVYGAGSDTIDGSASVTLQVGEAVVFHCVNTGTWISAAYSGSAGSDSPITTSSLTLTGATSGSTVVQASAIAGSTTLTLPAVTGTVASTSGADLAVIDTYRCTTAQTANANVVPANITGLSGSVVVGTYEFEAALYCTVASGTAGIAINQLLTTAVLGACNFEAAAFLAAGIATQATTTVTSGTVLFTAADQPILILIKGSFTVTTAGTFGLQMCQNTSNASNTVVNIGSTMKLNRIA